MQAEQICNLQKFFFAQVDNSFNWEKYSWHLKQILYEFVCVAIAELAQFYIFLDIQINIVSKVQCIVSQLKQSTNYSKVNGDVSV